MLRIRVFIKFLFIRLSLIFPCLSPVTLPLTVEMAVLPSNSLGVISLFQCFTLLNYK